MSVCPGGAVEITLTGYKSTTAGASEDETLRVLGYVSLVCNTICMVRNDDIRSNVKVQRSLLLLHYRRYMFYYKRNSSSTNLNVSWLEGLVIILWLSVYTLPLPVIILWLIVYTLPLPVIILWLILPPPPPPPPPRPLEGLSCGNHRLLLLLWGCVYGFGCCNQYYCQRTDREMGYSVRSEELLL